MTMGIKRIAMVEAWATRVTASKARDIAILALCAGLAALIALSYASGTAQAGSEAVTSGLPVPRFVSLKADR